MKKILTLLVIVLLGWLAKLSYDVMQLSQTQVQLQQSLHQNEQKNANLNDRLIALQRDKDQSVPQYLEQHVQGTHPLVLIQQQLDLIEFALKQQQYGYALEKLSHLEADLKQAGVSDSLKAALAAAIVQDRQDIQKFVNARQVQQQQVNQLLQQLDVVITAEVKQPQPHAIKQENSHFWQKWLQIESVAQPSQLLMQRQFVLKEAQLHLLLARQLLLQGQYLAYQQEMSVVAKILQQLPDQTAKNILQKIEQAKSLSTLATPALTTRALLR
jgi:hypothetical protein